MFAIELYKIFKNQSVDFGNLGFGFFFFMGVFEFTVDAFLEKGRALVDLDLYKFMMFIGNGYNFTTFQDSLFYLVMDYLGHNKKSLLCFYILLCMRTRW